MNSEVLHFMDVLEWLRLHKELATSGNYFRIQAEGILVDQGTT